MIHLAPVDGGGREEVLHGRDGELEDRQEGIGVEFSVARVFGDRDGLGWTRFTLPPSILEMVHELGIAERCGGFPTRHYSEDR